MFTAGPPVVEAAGEKVTAEQLGGADLHAGTGQHRRRRRQRGGRFRACRAVSCPTCRRAAGEPRRACPATIPRTAAKPGSIPRFRATGAGRTRSARSSRRWSIAAACSRSAAPGAARSSPHSRASTAWPVAVIASDPGQMGGTWTAAASRKMTRLVELAETFRLPVVHFVDVGGFTIGSQAEKAGTIRDGTRAHRHDLPVHRALVRSDPAARLRRRRRGHDRSHAFPLPHRLAERRLGLAAARGRHRGRVQGAASMPRPTPRRPSARSASGSSGCARRSGPRSVSTSRRSCRRPRRAAGCASSRGSRRPSLPRRPRVSAIRP